jgi:hypothetical protein
LNVLVPDEDIYVLSNVSLLGGDAISQARVALPKRRQRLSYGLRRFV